MKEKKKLLITFIIFVVVIVVVGIAYNNLVKIYDKFMSNNETQNQIATNTTLNLAPDFTIYDNNDNIIKLSDFKGKPVVINFWTTWCGYCVQEMPYFNEAYNTYKDEVQFIMLNVPDGPTETKENVENFINENNYDFEAYYDKEFDAVNKYSVTGYPITIFINKQGELFKINSGVISKSNLLKYIDSIIK